MDFDNIGRRRAPQQDGIQRSRPPIAKWATIGVLGFLAVTTALGSFYTVSPTEMAGVRRFGIVQSTQPEGPGLHFKLPWIDKVDKIQVSLTKFGVDNLNVYTIDNQPVTISVRMTYDVPKASVFHLMYDVGQAGNFDTWTTIEPVVADRAMRVFASENTVNISEDRGKIAHEIEKEIQDAVGPMFGLNIRDLQIIAIQYGKSFEDSINAAVMAKNAAISAENTVNQRKFEADQAKIVAEGQANAAIQSAQGERQAAILKAQGDAQARVLIGDAQAKAIRAVGAAVTENPQIIQYEIAKGWNGHLPSTMAGNGALPLLNLNPGKQQ